MIRSILVLFTGGVLAMSASAGQSQSGAPASAQTETKASAQAGGKDAQASAGANASTNTSAQGGPGRATFTSGTAFNAVLSGSVDAKKNKPGDSVTAHTAEAVKSDGKVALPKGAKLIGHVTEAKARAKGQSESALGIVFDRAVLKNGREIPLNVTIQAIGAAQASAAAAGDDLDAMAGAGASAGAYGGGAARGGLGGLNSAAGGAVGAAASTAGNVGGAAGGAVSSTVNSTANVAGHSSGAVGGLNTAGMLTSNSRGVFGLNGLNLNASAVSNTQGSVITSTSRNVHLDSGTRMLLVAQGQASAQANP